MRNGKLFRVMSRPGRAGRLPIKTISALAAAIAVLLSCAAPRAGQSSFAVKYPAFAKMVWAAEDEFNMSPERRAAAEAHIAEWLADCKFPAIDRFITLLAPGDVKEIVRVAETSRLVSDEGVPVAEDPAAYGQATLLSLPFDGVWQVIQGNRGAISHFPKTNNEYAWDLIIVRKGQQAGGNAQVNETHYCWDEPVIAPAPGLVVQVEDSLDDHPPYTPNPPKRGNHVYIDHENGELSLLYHLKKGSAMVKTGDRVKRGQPVGRCGDTGISTFPHLHFALYTGTVKKHKNINARFGGYFLLRSEIFDGSTRNKAKLKLSGIPKLLDYLVNGAELAAQNNQ